MIRMHALWKDMEEAHKTGVVLSGSGAGAASHFVKPRLVSLHVFLPDKMKLGTRRPCTATGKYSDGIDRDLTDKVTWSSAPPGIVTIDAQGFATAHKVGGAAISAEHQDSDTVVWETITVVK